MKKITFITYVYGEEFIEFFFRWSLPSVVRAIEKSEILSKYILEYRLITSEPYVSALSNGLTPLATKLGLKVHVQNVDNLNLPSREKCTSHIDVWDQAIGLCDDSFCLILIPDNIYELGFVSAFVEAMESGVDYFTNYPLYTCMESLILEDPGRIIDANSRADLISIFLDHTHPLIYSWLLDYNEIANIDYEIVCSEDVNDFKLTITNVTEHPVGINLYKIPPKDFYWLKESDVKNRSGVFYPAGSLSVDTVMNQFEMVFEATNRCDKSGLMADFVRKMYKKNFWFDSPMRSFRLGVNGVELAKSLAFPTVSNDAVSNERIGLTSQRLKLGLCKVWMIFQCEPRPFRYLFARFVRVLAVRVLGNDRFNRVKIQYKDATKLNFAIYVARGIFSNLARRLNESKHSGIANVRHLIRPNKFIPEETARRTISKDFCLAFYSDALKSYTGRLGVKSRHYINEGAQDFYLPFPAWKVKKIANNLTLLQRTELHNHLNEIFFQGRVS